MLDPILAVRKFHFVMIWIEHSKFKIILRNFEVRHVHVYVLLDDLQSQVSLPIQSQVSLPIHDRLGERSLPIHDRLGERSLPVHDRLGERSLAVHDRLGVRRPI